MENPLNPYTDNLFLDFFYTLITRLFLFMTGKLSLNQLANDEIQLIVLMAISAASALIGCFLVLRKMTMLANSLSHTILIGIVGAFFLSHVFVPGEQIPADVSLNLHIMLLAAFIMGLVTSFLTEFLTKTLKMQEDASTGIIFTTLFAAGIILVTVLTRNAHIGTEIVMGNADALYLEDGYLAGFILSLDLIVLGFFFKEFKITTFDPNLSQALGISPSFFNYLLMTLVSITIIGAFRAVGVLMVLSFITGPPLTARLLTARLKVMLALAASLGVLASLVGVALSRHILSAYGIALSTGGIVVCITALFFVLALLYTKLRLRKTLNHQAP
ncbi:metal ABC transporter permease [Parachlamydia sp. AcF125]|uniref:metal ABC transporter permease n=1 Tax=Parachlamydia sp. AcF125 TaxID=2795736 RepID=UPI001BC9D151|nr:metal ABC transporter permease [Parachlamydia sp. AcF125]MBS4167908.1 Manganese transport system membrane protein MntB [Parachlamydia sp. AcF125]